MRTEKEIRSRIERAIGRYRQILLLSNPCGVAKFTRERTTGEISGMPDLQVTEAPITYGLGGDGGPDLIGFIHWRFRGPKPPPAVGFVEIKGTQAFGIECKAPGKTRTQNQIMWHLRAKARGMWILEECTADSQAVMWLGQCFERLRAAGLEPVDADPEILAQLRAAAGHK